MGAAAPRFRNDLNAAEVEADGVMYVEVSDARSGKSFRFYDFEYAVARKLDGRPLSDVAREIRNELQLELTPEQLEAFGDQLRSLGFLSEDAEAFFPPLVDDESGEFEMPNLATPGPTPAPRPVTPPPTALGPATAAAAPPPKPATPPPKPATPATPPPIPATPPPTLTPAPARSLTENTITSFPPEVAPAAAAAAPRPPLDPLVSGPFAPATTPRPELKPPAGAAEKEDPTERTQDLRDEDLISLGTNGNGAHASSNGHAERREVDAQHKTVDKTEDRTQDRTEDKTPPADTRSGRRTPTGPAATRPGDGDSETDEHTPAVASTGAEAGPTSAGPSIKERRELPTQRLRAVSAEVAEDPEARRPPKVDADVDDDEDEELETAASVGPVPAAPLARSVSGGGLTPAATGGRQAWLAYAALGVAAAGIISVMVYKYLANPEPAAITVRVMVPSPTTVYRYWDATAKVERVEAPAFSFPSDGKVAELAGPGTRYNAGDVLALLEAGKRFRSELAHNRERLGAYEQMRETMIQQNNRPEVRQAEIKIAEKKRLIAEAQANLSKQAIIAAGSGEVGETMAAVGATVKAGDTALKAKGTGYRTVVELPKEDAEKARQLGFCRVEIDGKPLECSLAAEGGDETHVVIDLPNNPVVGTGKSVRLAKDRLDAVFSVPTGALLRIGDSDRLFVVTPAKRAELRVVAVAERVGQEAIVTQGLDVGDRVIVDPPPGLKTDARVLYEDALSK